MRSDLREQEQNHVMRVVRRAFSDQLLQSSLDGTFSLLHLVLFVCVSGFRMSRGVMTGVIARSIFGEADELTWDYSDPGAEGEKNDFPRSVQRGSRIIKFDKKGVQGASGGFKITLNLDSTGDRDFFLKSYCGGPRGVVTGQGDSEDRDSFFWGLINTGHILLKEMAGGNHHRLVLPEPREKRKRSLVFWILAKL
jgi:hypothetical protein